MHGNVLFINRGGRRLLGMTDDEPSGTVAAAHPEWARKLVGEHAIPTAIRDGIWRGESALLTRDGREIPVSQVILCHRGSSGDVEFISTIIRDVSERKQAEETIRKQADALLRLSTPLIPISDDIVVMPLIGVIDSARAQRVMATLLEGIAQSQARVAILDITGVSLVDEEVATAIVSAAKAVGLLGANVVLTGIRPEVARTLVDLGVDLGSIVTRSNLQGGIRHAMGALGGKPKGTGPA
jgi:rsbT co-antagonist protein RsbR